jgi:hypothetical protein
LAISFSPLVANRLRLGRRHGGTHCRADTGETTIDTAIDPFE